MANKKNRYVQIMEAIFSKYYRAGATEVPFERADIIQAAEELGIRLPKNPIVQIEQDLAVCASKFPGLICRPIAAQLMDDERIALFEFEQTDEGVRMSVERHYRLVHPEELSPEELESYRRRPF